MINTKTISPKKLIVRNMATIIFEDNTSTKLQHTKLPAYILIPRNNTHLKSELTKCLKYAYAKDRTKLIKRKINVPTFTNIDTPYITSLPEKYSTIITDTKKYLILKINTRNNFRFINALGLPSYQINENIIYNCTCNLTFNFQYKNNAFKFVTVCNNVQITNGGTNSDD